MIRIGQKFLGFTQSNCHLVIKNILSKLVSELSFKTQLYLINSYKFLTSQ